MRCFLSCSWYLRPDENRCTRTLTSRGGGDGECASPRDPILTLQPPNPVKKWAEGSSVCDPGPAGVTHQERDISPAVCPEGRQSWPDGKRFLGVFFP